MGASQPGIEPEEILVVDDYASQREALADALAATGYRVRTAEDGAGAIALVEEQAPDLILLDIRLPDLDGYEVCRRLREGGRLDDIPVIFISGLNEADSLVKGFQVGAVDYVTKPVKLEEVRARVATHLKLRRYRLQLQEQNRQLQEAAAFRDEVARITQHDLKTPLTGIITAAAMVLEDGGLSADQVELLHLIEQSGRRMLNMINSSLDLFRMEQGLYRYEPCAVDLLEVMFEVVDDLQPIAEAFEAPVEIFLDGEPAQRTSECRLLGERTLLYSLISNLVKNAIEASPPDAAVVVTIVSRPRIRIEIRNRGAVPESVRGRFFEKFVSHGKKAGTGLGTYAAKLIAETLGGTIELVESGPEETMIRLTFPALD